MAEPTRWRVEPISTAETHPVRLAVLRFDTPTKEVSFPQDDDPRAVHLGVRAGDEVVATSTWIPRPAPDGTDPAVQLRGMATMQHLQGTGVGAALIAAGCEHARSLGAVAVWANARDRAMSFYLREGFVIVGDGFVDEATQLPHHVVIRRL
ncbi:MAG: GNAT family N-acetyltransferase [Acidimicrobiales bacterium]|nr:GNAT family N-acetyltransferase [Acidimicrobiales bacterium]